MASSEHDPNGNSKSASNDHLVELNALLGRGTSYSGKLHFTGRVRIEGAFNGEIRGDDVLVIGAGAQVEGDIEVGVCIVTGGRIDADIRAREAIELHAPAVVRGDLHAPNVFIDRGVQFEGQCKMSPLDDSGASPGAALDGASPASEHDGSTVVAATEPGGSGASGDPDPSEATESAASTASKDTPPASEGDEHGS